MADNPFAKYASGVPGTKVDDNPFSRFAQTGTVGAPDPSSPESAFPRMAQRKKLDLDVTQPIDKLRDQIAAMSPDDQAEALKQWAEATVTKEHETQPLSTQAADKLRQFARGTPLGSWLDEAIAATPFLPSEGKAYAERKAYQDERNKRADETSTKLFTLPKVDIGPIELGGDVTTGGLVKLAGGLVTAPYLPGMGLKAGASLLSQIPKLVAAGGGYGGIYGAGEGNGAEERTGNAAVGTALGSLIGGAAQPVARGFGNLWGGLTGMARRNPAELRGMSRTAVRNVSDDMEAGGLLSGRPTDPNHVLMQARALGPEGMLADMSPNLQAHAGGLATKPGITAVIANPIMARDAKAGARLDAAQTQAMGRPVDVPAMIQTQKAKYRAAAGPLYKKFEATPIKPTEELVSLFEAVPPEVYKQAEKLMRMERVDPSSVAGTGKLVDYVKRALSDEAHSPKNVDMFGNIVKNEGRVYKNLEKAIVDEVDRILAPKDPSQSIWAQARRTANEHIDLDKAFKAGQSAFSRKLTNGQMEYELKRMTPDEQSFYRMGARQNLAAEAEGASTRFGPNGDTKTMATLGSESAKKKIELIAATPRAGRELNRTVEAEARFAGTSQDVLRNSKTAVRTEQAKRYNLDSNDVAVHNLTLEGMAFAPLRKVTDMIVNGALSAKRIKDATDAARMLVAQGAERDQIIKGLIQYKASASLNNAQRNAITQVVNRLIHGARPAALDAEAAKRANAQ